jgi:hypothetical protein
MATEPETDPKFCDDLVMIIVEPVLFCKDWRREFTSARTCAEASPGRTRITPANLAMVRRMAFPAQEAATCSRNGLWKRQEGRDCPPEHHTGTRLRSGEIIRR